MSYLTLDELRQLSTAELRALWELVPTERQRAYRSAYDREVRTAGAVGSDALEQRVCAELMKRYAETALVPVGSRWARTPGRVQEAARQNVALDAPEDDAGPVRRVSPKVSVAGLLAMVVLAGLLISRLFGGGAPDTPMDVTPSLSPTPTALVSPTPTPLALEAQDDVIRGGDSERAVAYPVNLQVVMPGSSAPRVWVVQRRAVRTAEWNFDPNPDIASFVSGMSVRPVIGIPYSEDNAALFEALDAGAVFNLTLNTGAILRYEFAARTEVLRSDTRIFRQVGPGLVLLLIGETDADGLPTATRALVTAAYPPEQELARSGELIPVSDPLPLQATPTPTPEATAEPGAGVDVRLVSVTHTEGRLMTHLRIYNGQDAPLSFTPDDIWLALGYAEDPPGPRIPAEGMQAFTLLPGQAADVSLVWPWSGEPYAALGVKGWRWGVRVE